MTFMGKGLIEADSELALGAVGLQAGDFALAGFDDTDVVIAVGYDLVELSPTSGTPTPTSASSASTRCPRRPTSTSSPRSSWSATSRRSSACWGASAAPHRWPGVLPVCARRSSRCLEDAAGDESFPVHPPRALLERAPEALGRGHRRLRRRAAQALDRPGLPGLRAEHGPDRQRPRRNGLRRPRRDCRKARPSRAQGCRRLGRRGLSDERPGARDGDAPRHRVRQRRMGEPPVRLDRLEAGPALRAPLRHRLRQPRLRRPRRVFRDARLARRVGRRLRRARARSARARRPLPDRRPGRLLARHLARRGAGSETTTRI